MPKVRVVTIIVFFATFLFFSCTNSVKKETKEATSLEALSAFVCDSKAICDTIAKLKNKNSKLLICTQQIGKSGKVITLTESCIPFPIAKDYYYKKINGLDVIFYDFNTPLVTTKKHKEIELLLQKNIVKIEPNTVSTCCIMPYYLFSICNATKELHCYDFETKAHLEKEYFKSRKVSGSISTYDLLCAHCD